MDLSIIDEPGCPRNHSELSVLENVQSSYLDDTDTSPNYCRIVKRHSKPADLKILIFVKLHESIISPVFTCS